MTNEQKQVRDWMSSFGQETPEKPGIPSLEVRKLRAKLILEEALETIMGLGFLANIEGDSDQVFPDLSNVYFTEYSVGVDLNIIADGCSDLKVVTEGTLVACGLVKQECQHELSGTGFNDPCKVCGKPPIEYLSEQKVDPLFNEVMRSNWSKMWKTKEVQEIFIWSPGEIYGRHKKDGELYSVIKVKLNLDTPRETTKYIVKDKSGKVIKSSSYSPANLEPIIEEIKK